MVESGIEQRQGTFVAQGKGLDQGCWVHFRTGLQLSCDGVGQFNSEWFNVNFC